METEVGVTAINDAKCALGVTGARILTAANRQLPEMGVSAISNAKFALGGSDWWSPNMRASVALARALES